MDQEMKILGQVSEVTSGKQEFDWGREISRYWSSEMAS
jgi:hypothetical protein